MLETINPKLSELKMIKKKVIKSSITVGRITPVSGRFLRFAKHIIAVTITASTIQSVISKIRCEVMYDEICIPDLCSRFIIARSLQIDWIELKIPIHIQAQTSANAPFCVALYSANISALVTEQIISVIIAELINTFQPLSLKNTLKQVLVYIFT